MVCKLRGRAVLVGGILSMVVRLAVAGELGDTWAWQGVYAGLHVGVADGNLRGIQDCCVFDPGDDPGNLNLDGVIGGFYLGSDFKFDRIVVGLEGDLSGSNIKDSQFSQSETPPNFSTIDIGLFSTIRGRAGWDLGDVTVFATGGVAFVDADYTMADPGTAKPLGEVNLFGVGWVAGGGFEWAVSPSVSLRTEGLYLGFNTRKSTAELTSDSEPGDFVELQNLYIFRLGVSYHF